MDVLPLEYCAKIVNVLDRELVEPRHEEHVVDELRQDLRVEHAQQRGPVDEDVFERAPRERVEDRKNLLPVAVDFLQGLPKSHLEIRSAEPLFEHRPRDVNVLAQILDGMAPKALYSALKPGWTLSRSAGVLIWPANLGKAASSCPFSPAKFLSFMAAMPG